VEIDRFSQYASIVAEIFKQSQENDFELEHLTVDLFLSKYGLPLTGTIEEKALRLKEFYYQEAIQRQKTLESVKALGSKIQSIRASLQSA